MFKFLNMNPNDISEGTNNSAWGESQNLTMTAAQLAELMNKNGVHIDATKIQDIQKQALKNGKHIVVTTTGGNQEIQVKKILKNNDTDSSMQGVSDLIQVQIFSNFNKQRAYPFMGHPMTKQEKVEQDFKQMMQRTKELFVVERAKHSNKPANPFFVQYVAQGQFITNFNLSGGPGFQLSQSLGYVNRQQSQN